MPPPPAYFPIFPSNHLAVLYTWMLLVITPEEAGGEYSSKEERGSLEFHQIHLQWGFLLWPQTNLLYCADWCCGNTGLTFWKYPVWIFEKLLSILSEVFHGVSQYLQSNAAMPLYNSQLSLSKCLHSQCLWEASHLIRCGQTVAHEPCVSSGALVQPTPPFSKRLNVRNLLYRKHGPNSCAVQSTSVCSSQTSENYHMWLQYAVSFGTSAI